METNNLDEVNLLEEPDFCNLNSFLTFLISRQNQSKIMALFKKISRQIRFTVKITLVVCTWNNRNIYLQDYFIWRLLCNHISYWITCLTLYFAIIFTSWCSRY